MKKLFFATFLFLSSCGFSPLYQSISAENGNIPVRVEPIPDQYGSFMQKIIQNKLGNSTDTSYTLAVSAPTFHTWDQTIDDKNFTTIMGIKGGVHYKLTETKTKKVILDNSTSLSSSYSVVKDPYATTVAERKVKKELAEQLAEQVSLHVLAALAGVHQ